MHLLPAYFSLKLNGCELRAEPVHFKAHSKVHRCDWMLYFESFMYKKSSVRNHSNRSFRMILGSSYDWIYIVLQRSFSLGHIFPSGHFE